LWTIQQAVLSLLLAGYSLPLAKFSRSPRRATISRWWNWLQEKFSIHADTLRAHDPELGRCSGFQEFWQACLTRMSLSEAMYVLHKGGLTIP
jgi:hypothetical protein